MTINAKFMALTQDATDEEIRETFAHAVLENKGYQHPAEAVKKWFASVEPKILNAVTKCGRTVLRTAASATVAEAMHSIMQKEVRQRFDKRPDIVEPDLIESWETLKKQCEGELAEIAQETQSIHEKYHKALLTSINMVHVLYNIHLASSIVPGETSKEELDAMFEVLRRQPNEGGGDE